MFVGPRNDEPIEFPALQLFAQSGKPRLRLSRIALYVE
jgi:hypothetical protein